MSETLGPAPLLDRREAIRRVGALLGGVAWVGGAGLLAAVERAHAAADASGSANAVATASIGEFGAAQIALLDEIAETILPATRTPGAKAAKTGAFMALMVTDAYAPAERRVFLDGLNALDDAMRKAHAVTFMQASPSQRLEVLTVLDREQKHIMDGRAADTGRDADDRRDVPYFRMMKELALLGFFTSKIGCTQVQRYIEAPGRYDPCAPYAPGEPSWALHA